MKLVALPVVGLVLALLSLPVVLATGDAPLERCGPQGGSVDVVLLTAIATLGAFLYNMSASLLGGIEVTLAEDR